MKDWFYIEDGSRQGPVPEADMLTRVRSGQIKDDTLVWTHGLSDWQESRSAGLLPAELCPPPIPRAVVQVARSAPPPLPARCRTTVTKSELDPNQTRPWLRYFARMADVAIFSVLVGLTLGVFYPGDLDISEHLLGLATVAVFPLFEAAALCQFGRTPAKWMLSMRVERHDRRQLTYSEALVRSYDVWFRGVGVGVPLFALIGMLCNYNNLVHHGGTLWDKARGTTVVHYRLRSGRVALFTLVCLAYAYLISIG